MDDEREFDLELEWEAPPEAVSAFYVNNGWKLDMKGQLRAPTPEEIEKIVRYLIDRIEAGPGGIYLTLYRLKIYKDPDFPDSYEIYVKIGHASPRVPEGSR